ncbi:MAG TPA: hypothetical protein VF137_02660 [Candidatus Dormibacteraeota bacterium]
MRARVVRARVVRDLAAVDVRDVEARFRVEAAADRVALGRADAAAGFAAAGLLPPGVAIFSTCSVSFLTCFFSFEILALLPISSPFIAHDRTHAETDKRSSS